MQSMQKQGGYQPSFNHWVGVWLNRARLLHAVPMPDADRAALLEWICYSKYPTITPGFDQMVQSDIARPEVKRWIDRMKKGSYEHLRPWIITDPTAGMIETPSKVFPVDAWENPPTTAAPFTPPFVPPPVIHRTREVCHMCDALDSYAVYSSRDSGRVQYMKCKKCGSNAVRMNHGPIMPNQVN
jgi:hypothetical protein